MAYKKKEFIDYIISTGGVKSHKEMVEGRNSYHAFFIQN